MRIRGFILSLLVALAVFALASHSLAGPADFYGAACRVSTPHGLGSGACYSVDQRVVAVLTCHHVVKNERVVWLEFYRPSGRSAKIIGQVLISRPNVDAAIIVIPTPVFRGITPKALPPARKLPPPGTRVSTVGCPYGKDLNGYTATIVGYQGNEMLFAPPPAQGRSGSAIADINGEQLLAILWGQEPTNGRAHTITAIAADLDVRVDALSADWKWDESVATQCVEEVQCPGGNCGPGADEDRFRNGGLFGKRNPPQQQPAIPWPNEPTPAPPPADLSPILGALGNISQQIGAIRPSTPPAPVGPDPAVTNALQQLGNLANVADQKADAAIKGVGEVKDKIVGLEKAVEPIAKIHAKLEEDAAAGGIKGRIAQRILDKVEGTGDGDEKFGVLKTLFGDKAILFVLLGVGAVVLLFVRKDIKDKKATGDPLAIEKLLDKVGGLRDKATDLLPAPANIAIDAAMDKVHKRIDDLAGKLTSVALAVPAPAAPVAPAVAKTP